MKKRTLMYVICLALLATFMAVSSAFSVEVEKLTGKKFAQLARGGILYDNWLVEIGVKTDKTHPSYPASGKQTGAITWRCKECHGWDYKGKGGAYSAGSHYTGITGIRAYANQDPEGIKKLIKNDAHAFSTMIPDEDLEALALFVAFGQVDTDVHIDRATKKSAGDAANGGRIFLATCTKCHNEDGKAMNFKDEKDPEYIGTVANKNPWETLHKIRWGHAGAQMISLLFLDLREQLDVLSFCQTLPEK